MVSHKNFNCIIHNRQNYNKNRNKANHSMRNKLRIREIFPVEFNYEKMTFTVIFEDPQVYLHCSLYAELIVASDKIWIQLCTHQESRNLLPRHFCWKALPTGGLITISKKKKEQLWNSDSRPKRLQKGLLFTLNLSLPLSYVCVSTYPCRHRFSRCHKWLIYSSRFSVSVGHWSFLSITEGSTAHTHMSHSLHTVGSAET